MRVLVGVGGLVDVWLHRSSGRGRAGAHSKTRGGACGPPFIESRGAIGSTGRNETAVIFSGNSPTTENH